MNQTCHRAFSREYRESAVARWRNFRQLDVIFSDPFTHLPPLAQPPFMFVATRGPVRSESAPRPRPAASIVQASRGNHMNLHKGKLLLAGLTMAAVALGAGCASTSSTKAKSLKTTASANALEDCANITVVAFTVPGKVDASVGVNFAQNVESRLGSDFGPIFQSVEMAPAARGLDHECVVQGAITKYKPGSRVARAILIGLGAASLEGNVTIKDAASGNTLLNAPFDKLWAWGGIMGASKGIDDMAKEASASVAATVAHAKGWTPAGAK
jgi:hypothetical protein